MALGHATYKYIITGALLTIVSRMFVGSSASGSRFSNAENLLVCTGSLEEGYMPKYNHSDDELDNFHGGNDAEVFYFRGFMNRLSMTIGVMALLYLSWACAFMVFRGRQLLLFIGTIFCHGHFNDLRVMLAFIFAGAFHPRTNVEVHHDCTNYCYEQVLENTFYAEWGSRSMLLQFFKSKELSWHESI
jgi:hypothetical protein